MYSKLEEASYPLTQRQHINHNDNNDNFVKCGTYNPSKCKSFFVWKISNTVLEVHEINAVRQLKHNCFAYNFSRNHVYLQPQVEFVPFIHSGSGQRMIAFYVIASDWNLYRFEVLHPQQWSECNRNVSVLHSLQGTLPNQLEVASTTDLLFDENVRFKFIDNNIYKVLLCSSTRLSVINLDNNENEPTMHAGFVIHTKSRKQANTMALFSSFLPSFTSNGSAVPPTECKYICMQYHKFAGSRIVVGCLDNKGNLELYLVSNRQIHDKLTLNVHSNGGLGDDGSSNRVHHDIANANVLFYAYRKDATGHYFSVIVFYDVGGAKAIQCQYKEKENMDKLVLLNEFEVIHAISAQQAVCIDAKIYDHLLWCSLLSPGDNEYDYDIFCCDMRPFLNQRAAAPAVKWTFQRMWKRSQYIQRVLNSIENEFNFDTFYQQFELSCGAHSDLYASPSSSSSTTGTQRLQREQEYKQRLHELILNFWLIRLVDDPTLELNAQILESQLQRIARDENIESAQPHWALTTLDIFTQVYDNNDNANDDDHKQPQQEQPEQAAPIDLSDNATMKRIKFESKLQTLMIGVMEKRYMADAFDLRSKEYIKCVWNLYNKFFIDCLEQSKLYKKLLGIGHILDNKIIIIKQNGFSIIRDMDYAEQIEIYFDRYHDESDDDINDFRQPPIRLHKFVTFSQTQQQTPPQRHVNKELHSAIYHWFVACTWFYNQNTAVFNNDEFNLDDEIISNSSHFHEKFKNYISSHLDNLKSHTKKQIIDLYLNLNQNGNIDAFIEDIFEIFVTDFDANDGDEHDEDDDDMMRDHHHNRNNRNVQSHGHGDDKYLAHIWYETSLISCIESSFASIVAARYSLLRSIYVTFLYIFYDQHEYGNRLRHDSTSKFMSKLLDVLKSYFILSYLSSSIYQTKHYLGITHSSNVAPQLSSFASTEKRQELWSNLQSSFRSGLVVRHYLRYWYNKKALQSNISQAYFVSPLQYIRKLTALFLCPPRNHRQRDRDDMYAYDNHADHHHLGGDALHIALIYNVVEFMFCERQFEALQKILSYIHYISPLFKYFLARCHIELQRINNMNSVVGDQSNNNNNNENKQKRKKWEITELDGYIMNLLDDCCLYLTKPLRIHKEKCLLGLVLTHDCYLSDGGGAHLSRSHGTHNIDIYSLAPKDYIELPEEYRLKQERLKQQREQQSQQQHRKAPLLLSSKLSHHSPEYEWIVQLAYYAHIMQLYKNLVSKPKIVMKLASNAIEFINRMISKCKYEKSRSCSSTVELKNHDDEEDDEVAQQRQQQEQPALNGSYHEYKEMRTVRIDDEIRDKVMLYSGIDGKRADKLCRTFDNNLEIILLSVYKSNFILEIVSESLKMERYEHAYRYLIKFDDLYCAQTAIKEYVSTCCKQKKMDPILKQKWNESDIKFTEWTKYLLSFGGHKTNNIRLKPLDYRHLVELIIYNFALQFNIQDSFCFDLLYTFSMKNRDYKYAAKYMFEYVMRIEQYIQNKTHSIQKLQYHCLCQVLSALDLLDEEPPSKRFLLLDFKLNLLDAHTTKLIFGAHDRIVTYAQIKKYYIFIKSKYHLLSSLQCHTSSSFTKRNKSNEAALHLLDEHKIANLNVIETAMQLFDNGFYSQSLALLAEFENEDGITRILNKIVDVLLFGAANYRSPHHLHHHESELSWHYLEQILLDYDHAGIHFKYTLGVLHTILSFDAANNNNNELNDEEEEDFVLPSFVYNRIRNLHETQLDVLVVPLIELLCAYGKILHSVRLLCLALNVSELSIKDDCYNYQNHAFWRVAHKLYAYCATLALHKEQSVLLNSLASWIARPAL